MSANAAPRLKVVGPKKLGHLPVKTHQDVVLERQHCDATFDVYDPQGTLVGTGGRNRTTDELYAHLQGTSPACGEEYALLAMLGESGFRVRWTWHDTTAKSAN